MHFKEMKQENLLFITKKEEETSKQKHLSYP